MQTHSVLNYLYSLALIALAGVYVCATGCDSKKDSNDGETEKPVEIRKVTVNVLVVGDEKLGPVIKRQFSSRRNGVANLTELTWDEFESDEFQAARNSDVVIYPSQRIGELVTRELLVPINEENTKFEVKAKRALLFSDQGAVVSWAGQQYAFSLGQSHWVMLYRSDVLEATKTKKPPATWEEFDKLVEQIAELPEGDVPKRVAIPLKDHWASYSLLQRAASAIRVSGKYSSYFDVGTMSPLIATPPFAAALSAWAVAIGDDPKPQEPHEIMADFQNGKVAIAMVPLNRHWLPETEEAEFPASAIAMIPGWGSTYDPSRDIWTSQTTGSLLSVPLTGTTGMLASCSAGSKQQRNAIEVISWITSKQFSSIISVESPNAGLSRKSHLGNPEKWLGSSLPTENLTQFADVITEINTGRRQLAALRIPSADRYLQQLDDAVRSVILEGKDSAEQLTKAKSQWTELNNEIGFDAQKNAYRQSEGLTQ